MNETPSVRMRLHGLYNQGVIVNFTFKILITTKNVLFTLKSSQTCLNHVKEKNEFRDTGVLTFTF